MTILKWNCVLQDKLILGTIASLPFSYFCPIFATKNYCCQHFLSQPQRSEGGGQGAHERKFNGQVEEQILISHFHHQSCPVPSAQILPHRILQKIFELCRRNKNATFIISLLLPFSLFSLSLCLQLSQKQTTKEVNGKLGRSNKIPRKKSFKPLFLRKESE